MNNCKTLVRATDKGMHHLLRDYIKITSNPVESLSDFNKILKWNWGAINHVKRQQYLTKKVIMELKENNGDINIIKGWELYYNDLEKFRTTMMDFHNFLTNGYMSIKHDLKDH